MAKLYKVQHGEGTTEGATLLSQRLQVAESFFERAKGLLGRKTLEADEALWIKPCNNIHTCFMNFHIDCLFVDRNLVVVKAFSDVKTFRLLGPFWKSSSVFEMPAGTVTKFNIQAGDQIYVVD